MKTNKFEKTIRRKLESISPEFQESDWMKMQNYMQVHTPPTFWQQYSSWIGYAAAASVTSVMAFLYVNQLSQNNHLLSDVQKLQNQIEVIKNAPVVIPKSDTIYIVQKEPADNTRIAAPDITTETQPEANQQTAENATPFDREDPISDVTKNDAGNRVEPSAQLTPTSASGINKADAGQKNELSLKTERETLPYRAEQSSATSNGNKSTGSSLATTAPAAEPARSLVNPNETTLDNRFDAALEQLPSTGSTLAGSSSKMSESLANRLSGRQIKKVMLATNAASAKNVTSEKKVEKTENVIPQLNLKVPYRFGGGMSWEKNGVAKTIVGEVLISKKFSISAGLSWLKVKPMEFFTEKVFRERNRKDFKDMRPDDIPGTVIFEVLNIKVNPTLVQVPLTFAFRNSLKHEWGYYVSASTNVVVRAKEKFSYDCRVPNREFFNQSFVQKMDVPVINSVTFTAGIEKTWHPIVVQAEGYLYNYFKPLTPFNSHAGPGVRVKLLYQIGGKL